MAKKKNKIGLFDLLMMLMALVGLVLAVVGICIPFFLLQSKCVTHLSGAFYFVLFKLRESGL